VPRELAAMWQAAERLDLRAMRSIGDRLYPIVRGIYGRPPRMGMHTRIKIGLQHLGLIDCAVPRPPLLPVSAAVVSEVRRALDAAGISRERS